MPRSWREHWLGTRGLRGLCPETWFPYQVHCCVGCAPQTRRRGPPGPQHPRPETLSLDSENMWVACVAWGAHAECVTSRCLLEWSAKVHHAQLIRIQPLSFAQAIPGQRVVSPVLLITCMTIPMHPGVVLPLLSAHHRAFQRRDAVQSRIHLAFFLHYGSVLPCMKTGEAMSF